MRIVSGFMPRLVAACANALNCCTTVWRKPAGSGWLTELRICGTSARRPLASASSGLRPENAPTSMTAASARSSRAAGAAGRTPASAAPASATAGRRRPGVGTITVASGSIDMGVSCGRSIADGPELEAQAGEIARDMHGDHSRRFERLPVLALAIELEVGVARVVRNLTRRHRQRRGADAGEMRNDQVADLLRRPELYLRREMQPQRVGRQIGADREHENRLAEEIDIRHGAGEDTA